jgi:uncharacterized alkaline shock family protein YloU
MPSQEKPTRKTKSDPTPVTRGVTTIAPDVLHTIARLTALNVSGVSRFGLAPMARMNQWFKSHHSNGVQIDIQDDVVFADLYIILKSDVNIREVSRKIQRDVARAISEMVGMQVGRVNIHVEDIDYPDKTTE